jgi:hypothetical protein
MNKEDGGKQRSMHSTMVTEEIVGPYNPLLKCNDCQDMIFTKSDDGPFYMDPEERMVLREQDLLSAKFVMKDRKKLLKEIFSSKLIPNENVSIKIGKQTVRVLLNRSNQKIYESGGNTISIQLLRKYCRGFGVSWRTTINSDSEELWKDKTRLQLLKVLEDGNHIIDKTKKKT